jgi:glycosyltransferase involved in cell wall biosynthesis
MASAKVLSPGLRLGLLPPLNSGLRDLAQSGQDARLVGKYFPAYAAAFEHLYYFSYQNEQLADYSSDPELLRKVTVLPGQKRNSYAFKMPLRWSSEMQSCHVLRAFQITGVLPAVAAKVRWGIPFVATYGYRYAEFARVDGKVRRAFFLWLLEQIGLRSADAVIVTTPALAAHARAQRGEDGIHLIANGADLELFRPAPRLPGKRRVVFVGRLEPQKNLMMLVEALARIQPAPHLLIIGDGAHKAALQEAAVQLGVDLELAGVVPNEALGAKLVSADLFALPSLIEGHPKALVEAMSCGLACVGLDVPGVRDVITHEQTGLLCAPNVGALAKAIARVLDDAALANRLGQAARVWSVEHYDLKRQLQREVELLHILAARKR